MFLEEVTYAVYSLHLPLQVVWSNACAEVMGGESNYVMPMEEVAAYLILVFLAGALLHLPVERLSWLGSADIARPAVLPS